MMAKFPPAENPFPSGNAGKLLRSGDVSVEFREANKNADRNALPGIDPSACYRIGYFPGSGYQSFRAYNYERNASPEAWQVMKNLPGNPEKGYINIGGTLFKYDPSGTVFDLRGRAAGVMLCYHTNNCEQFRYSAGVPAAPQRIPYNGPAWNDIGTTIAKGVLEGNGTKLFETILSNANTHLSSALDARLQAIAEDIEKVFARYLSNEDLVVLDSLEEKCGDAVAYAHEYGMPLIPSYVIFASLWLAANQEQTKKSAEKGFHDTKWKAITSLLEESKEYVDRASSQVSDEVYNGYTEVFAFRGGFTWKRKRDGVIHHPIYKTNDEAYDAQVAELATEASEANAKLPEKNPDIRHLKEIRELWQQVEDRACQELHCRR